MNFKKSASILRKINGIHDSLRENQEQPSSIEKDLLRSYLRDFYELLVETEEKVEVSESISTKESKTEFHNTPEVRARVAPIAAPIFQEEPKAVRIEEAIPAPSLNGGHAAVETKVESPKVVEEIQEIKVEEKVIEVTTETEPVEYDEALYALFEQKTVSDLSEKLGQRPITDMKRSMGINEQILTRNELFNSDQDLFISTLVKLNEFTKYDEAAKFLMAGVAKDQDWSHASKKKKADGFIKLVQRRYLA